MNDLVWIQFDPNTRRRLWTGVSRNFFNDKLEVKLYNYWSPNYFGETGNNDVLEFRAKSGT